MLVRDPQIIQNPPPHDRLFHDPGDILNPHTAVPDPLRVENDGRSKFALFKATSLVGADQWYKPATFDLTLERVAQSAGPCGIATAAGMAGLATVTADEQVASEAWHEYACQDMGRPLNAANLANPWPGV